MIEISGEAAGAVADYDTAKKIAETLNKHYPGHLWGVTASQETGVATIMNLRLSGRWGFIVKLSDILHDPSLKKVIQAGGEILERYKVSRGVFDQDRIDDLAVDFSGNHKADM